MARRAPWRLRLAQAVGVIPCLLADAREGRELRFTPLRVARLAVIVVTPGPGRHAPSRWSEVREALEELERLSAERWAREVQAAAAASKEPARALSPAFAAKARAKLRRRAVINKTLAAISHVHLDEMD